MRSSIAFLALSLALLMGGLASPAYGQSGQTRVQEVQVPTNSKSLAHKTAVLEVSRDMVIGLLGQEKYQKKQKYIEQNILTQSNRYILSVHSSKGKWNDQGQFTFNVSLKVSKENLKKLLAEHYFFDYSKKRTFCVLPFISFFGPSGVYSWWLENNTGSQKAKDNTESVSTEPADTEPADKEALKLKAKAFFDLLSYELLKIGFYVQDPVFYQIPWAVPPSFLPKKAKALKHFMPLVDFYSCDIVLSGSIRIRGGTAGDILQFFLAETQTRSLEFSIKAFQAKTRYQILSLGTTQALPQEQGDSVSAFLEGSQKAVDSLVYQLSRHQEEGSLGWNRFLLNIQGSLSYFDQEKLAQLLVQKSDSLENLKVQYMNAGRVLYSAESSAPLKQVLKDLRQLSLRDFNIQARRTRKGDLELSAQKKP